MLVLLYISLRHSIRNLRKALIGGPKVEPIAWASRLDDDNLSQA